MRQAFDISTPMNIHERIEKVNITVATEVAITKTTNTRPNVSAGNDDGQKIPDERQQSMWTTCERAGPATTQGLRATDIVTKIAWHRRPGPRA